MEFKITHFTTGTFPGDQTVDYIDSEGNVNIEEIRNAAKILGGREAGICYMKDSYFSKGINNTETALKRANAIIDKHHSPFDHFTIGLEISGIPKICAMILNSLGFYNTSEKSARYTIMHPETDKELEVYDKWTKKFKDLIIKTYPNMETAPNLEKLAIENARYTISMFTPTSMGYTSTYRMYSYLYGWLKILINDHLVGSESAFNTLLIDPLREIVNFLAELTNEGEIADYKERRIGFLRKQYYPKDEVFKDVSKNDRVYPEIFGDVYQTTYTASIACLAQLQRHRTIDYQMSFDGTDFVNFYIPDIIEKNDKISVTEREDLIQEWFEDLSSVWYAFPQANCVDIIERGTADDFLLKAKERICGRAQLEIQNITVDTMNKFAYSGFYCIKDHIVREEFKDFSDHRIACGYENHEYFFPASKCMIDGYTCSEPCIWYKKCIGRLI